MSTPTITANVSEATLQKAKLAAVRAGKSLREFTGEILTAHFNPKAKAAPEGSGK